MKANVQRPTSNIQHRTVEGPNVGTFQRKPGVAFEAVQYFGSMGTSTATIPYWLIDACCNGTLFARGKGTYLRTAKGERRVNEGDFIVCAVGGVLRVMDEGQFHSMYEPVRRLDSEKS